MKNYKIKNKFFKSTMNLIGNKGFTKIFLGKPIKKYLIERCKTNEIVVNGYKMLLDENDFSKCGTHYHNKYIKPWWADEMVVTIVIGNHKFFIL